RIDEVLIIAHARVINQDVDMPECLGCSFNCALSRTFLPGVAEDADGLRAKLFCLSLELLQPLLAPRREHKPRALLRKGTGASLSNTGTRTGDQSHFSIEICRHIFILIFLF